MAKASKNDDIPSEIKTRFSQLHKSMDELKKQLEHLMNNYSMIRSSAKTPLEEAKLDLTITYAVNSLFWIYLSMKGVDVHKHDVKHELMRLKEYMVRTKEIEDKQKAPKIDVQAANRFIKHSIIDLDHIKESKKQKTS